MAKQESLLTQKAQLKWYEEGDCNSKFFHSIIKDKRRRLQLFRIKKWQMDSGGEKISKAACRHFERLFDLPEPRLDSNIFDCVPTCIEENDNRVLVSIPSAEEIKDAVFDMYASSSAGPDG